MSKFAICTKFFLQKKKFVLFAFVALENGPGIDKYTSFLQENLSIF